jgi:CelD/BcsL family acetyltransferase involved in cellulose biosynthesis
MKLELIRGTELCDALRQKWRELQSQNPGLASPYFCHEYTSLVAEVRGDVFVGVIEDAGEVLGFFPFQRGWTKSARPVGGIVSDYQGLIAAADLAVDPEWLLRSAGLVRWEFDHLLAEQKAFVPYHRRRERSPMLDLARGFEAYEASRRDQGTKLLGQLARKQRKLERELGPIRFEVQSTDVEALRRCMHWKSQQYRQSGIQDLFSLDWPVQLLQRLQKIQGEDFAGVLSTLSVGDRLIAAHMGMRSRRVWHYWFPSYEAELAKYSPGQILLLCMAKQAPSMGIGIIDLGKGDSRYKTQLASTAALVCEGRVEIPCSANRLAKLAEEARDWVERNPDAPWLTRLPGRALRKYERWARYQ